MRSCLGSILLFIVIVMLAATAFYQWNTNAKIEFSVRNPEDPMITTKRYSIDSLHPDQKPLSNKQDSPNQAHDPYSISDNVMPVKPVPVSQPEEDIPTAEPVSDSENIPTAEPVQSPEQNEIR